MAKDKKPDGTTPGLHKGEYYVIGGLTGRHCPVEKTDGDYKILGIDFAAAEQRLIAQECKDNPKIELQEKQLHLPGDYSYHNVDWGMVKLLRFLQNMVKDFVKKGLK